MPPQIFWLVADLWLLVLRCVLNTRAYAEHARSPTERLSIELTGAVATMLHSYLLANSSSVNHSVLVLCGHNIRHMNIMVSSVLTLTSVPLRSLSASNMAVSYCRRLTDKFFSISNLFVSG